MNSNMEDVIDSVGYNITRLPNTNVGDTISRQAAIDVASGFCHPANIAKELEKLPSVQPEVIRCKDCKHYLSPHGCGHIDGMVTSQKDGFCSYAER